MNDNGEENKNSSTNELPPIIIKQPIKLPVPIQLPQMITETLKDAVQSVTCPISNSIFLDPVMLSDGYTYERECVEECKKQKQIFCSPITRQPLSDTIITNRDKRDKVALILERFPHLKKDQYRLKIDPKTVVCTEKIRSLSVDQFYDTVDRLAYHGHINFKNKEHRQTFLTASIFCGRNLREIEYILKNGAFKWLCEKNGNDAFSVALAMGHTDVTNYFLNKCEKLRSDSWHLLQAVIHQPFDIVKRVAQMPGCNLDKQSSTRKETALHTAVRLFREDVVEFLLSCKVQLQRKDSMERTPFIMACWRGSNNMIKLIYDALCKQKLVLHNHSKGHFQLEQKMHVSQYIEQNWRLSPNEKEHWLQIVGEK